MPYINIVLRAKLNPSPKTLIFSSKTLETSPKPVDPNWVVLNRCKAKRVLAVGGVSVHPPCYTRWSGRSATTRRPCRPNFTTNHLWTGQIEPANAAAAATVGCWILMFFGHSRPTHTYVPPFFDPLNSFPWSLLVDSSPFERYDENKFGR